jgi:hypothetical protein
VIATTYLLTWFGIDNVFFDTISRQPEKVLALAASGQSSMRSFLNVNLLRGSWIFIPEVTVVCALLGYLGGRLTGRAPDPELTGFIT